MNQLTKYEQETVINFNAGEKNATIYTRDKAVIRKIDTLVTEFPEVYQCINETSIDKTYLLPKQYVSYRKPRKISAQRREQMRESMKIINKSS